VLGSVPFSLTSNRTLSQGADLREELRAAGFDDLQILQKVPNGIRDGEGEGELRLCGNEGDEVHVATLVAGRSTLYDSCRLAGVHQTLACLGHSSRSNAAASRFSARLLSTVRAASNLPIFKRFGLKRLLGADVFAFPGTILECVGQSVERLKASACQLDSVYFGRECQGFGMQVASPVIRLLFGCGPSAVAGLVIAVDIDPIERHTGGGPSSHIPQERLKAFAPCGAHSNPTPAVVFVFLVFRVIAAALRVGPREILACFCQFVRGFCGLMVLSPVAPTALAGAASQACAHHVHERTAIAATMPSRRSVTSETWSTFKHDQASESLAGKVNGWHGHTLHYSKLLTCLGVPVWEFF
jgi:hypothetical protein